MTVFSSDDVLEIPYGETSLLAAVGGAATMRRTAVILHGGVADGMPSVRQGISRALAAEGFAIVDVPLVQTFERKRRSPLQERDLHDRARISVAHVAGLVGAPVATVGLGALAGAALAAAGATATDVSSVAVVGQRLRAARALVRQVRAPALLVSEHRDGPTIDALRAIADDLSGVSEVRLLARHGANQRVEELVAEWCGRYTPSVVPLAAIERTETAVIELPTAIASTDVS